MKFLNVFGLNYSFELSAYDLFVFSLGSLVLVSFLLAYYNRISKKSPTKFSSESSKPLYSYKDVLLQEKNTNNEYIPISTHKSVALRIIAISLILLIIATPLYQLLNVNHFV